MLPMPAGPGTMATEQLVGFARLWPAGGAAAPFEQMTTMPIKIAARTHFKQLMRNMFELLDFTDLCPHRLAHANRHCSSVTRASLGVYKNLFTAHLLDRQPPIRPANFSRNWHRS